MSTLLWIVSKDDIAQLMLALAMKQLEDSYIETDRDNTDYCTSICVSLHSLSTVMILHVPKTCEDNDMPVSTVINGCVQDTTGCSNVLIDWDDDISTEDSCDCDLACIFPALSQ